MTSPPDCMWKLHCAVQSSSSEPSPQSSLPSHLNAWLTQPPLAQWIELCGHAADLHMNGKRLSHVSNSQDCADWPNETATHSPDSGFGWCRDQKPEYCDTSVPAADSNVFVRRSSSDAKPNQYLLAKRLLSAVVAIAWVTLFSAYESIATNSDPYLRKKKKFVHYNERTDGEIICGYCSCSKLANWSDMSGISMLIVQ